MHEKESVEQVGHKANLHAFRGDCPVMDCNTVQAWLILNRPSDSEPAYIIVGKSHIGRAKSREEPLLRQHTLPYHFNGHPTKKKTTQPIHFQLRPYLS